jgi:hypothetical protein
VRRVLSIAVATTLWAGTAPRKSPAEYDVSAETPKAQFGANFLSRSLGSGEEDTVLPEYLVAEVAVFPKDGATLTLASGDFRLRLNRSGRALVAENSMLVAAGVLRRENYPERGVTAGAGAGPADIVFGRPRSVERFPGDPTVRNPYPDRPRAPDGNGAPEGKAEPKRSLAEVLHNLELEEGPGANPRSGLLYFHWKGRIKNLQAIELIYEGSAGKVVLRLK